MNRRVYSVFGFAMLALVLCAPIFAATPVAVGTCQPAATPRYSTIQQAVNAVSPGGTVLVCAGVYPEQVTISQSLTLKGVPAGKNQEARIVAPLEGLVVNVVNSFLSGAAHVFVVNAGSVNIMNIAIQGLGDLPGCANQNYYGIAADSSNLTISGSAVRNIGTVQETCLAQAVAATGSSNSLTLANSSIHDGDQGLYALFLGQLTVNSSTMNDLSTGTIVAFPGIAPSITSNSFYNIGCPVACSFWTSSAIRAITGASPGGIGKITNNTIQMMPTATAGIDLQTFGMPLTVTGNRITGGTAGIQVNGASSSAVQSNTIQHSVIGIKIDDHGRTGANTISKNTIKETACGIWTIDSTGDTVGPNTFALNTMTTCP